MSWSLGVATGACPHRPLADVLPVIRASGATGIEVGTPPQHFDPSDAGSVERAAGAIYSLGLRPISIHAPFSKAADLASSVHHEHEAAISAVVPKRILRIFSPLCRSDRFQRNRHWGRRAGPGGPPPCAILRS